MNKLAILAMMSACVFFLAFNAVGCECTASVEVDTDGDCEPDLEYGPVCIDEGNTTALDLLDEAYDIVYTEESWGVFVTTIEGVTPHWDPPEFQDWWMFTVQHSGGCPYMETHDLRNYTVQCGDTIGMWNVTGFLEEWPCDC